MYIDTNFFVQGPIPVNAVVGVFNYSLVGMTFLIALLASYVGLDLIGQLRAEKNAALKVCWQIGSAIVIGVGIWSMHFIGIMSLHLSVPVEFDLFWTIGSLVIAIIIVWLAFFFLRNEQASKLRLFFGSIVLSFAVIITHYSGMEGLEVRIDVLYSPLLFFLSIATAVLGIAIALWMAFQINIKSVNRQLIQNILSALIMAVAMFGMYYISMKAAVFVPRAEPFSGTVEAASHVELAIAIAEIIGIIFFISIVISNYRQLRMNAELHNQQIKYVTDLEKGIAIKTEDVVKKNKQLSDVLRHVNEMQAQLLQSEKMATVGQLAAGIAHEINNPLSYVVSNISTLEKRVLKLNINNDISEIFHETEEGLSRIQKIINSLKIFSSGGEDLSEKKNVNVCIESAVALSWNVLKNKCVLHKNFGNLPDIFCNAQQLEVIFMNLLINAAESITDSGEITVVSTVNDAEIQISVSDNGSGISPDHLPRIFEPFFTTKLVGQSSGLGLTVSYNIVKIHGGTITVDSTVGKGSTFIVHLPIQFTDQNKKTLGNRKRILIVDDEVHLLRSLKRLLEDDYDVITAVGGKTAIELLAKDNAEYNAILIDLMMPDMTGADLYQYIAMQYPQVLHAIIFMSGGVPNAVKDFLNSVENPFLEKPFKKEEIISAIEKIK